MLDEGDLNNGVGGLTKIIHTQRVLRNVDGKSKTSRTGSK